MAVVHQHCQTEETLDSLEQNKELELKCVKLELSNKNLMEACASANGERDRLAETLKYHESNNKLLSDEIDELKVYFYDLTLRRDYYFISMRIIKADNKSPISSINYNIYQFSEFIVIIVTCLRN